MDQGTVRAKVYLLWHTHTFEDECECEKLIGVYSSKHRAEEALQRAAVLPGFCDAKDGFEICPYELNEDQWTSGYVTVTAGED
jgi:hypothetical protein